MYIIKTFDYYFKKKLVCKINVVKKIFENSTLFERLRRPSRHIHSMTRVFYAVLILVYSF